MPLVFVDCTPPRGFEDHPAIVTDSHLGSLKLGRHFAAHGYRAWAFLGHAPGWTTRRAREGGFREAAEECGATLDVIEGGNHSRTAAEALAAYLGARPRAKWPRALYASNEPLLNGALRALRERGLAIPAEMAVAGFDDFAWADLLDPPMTVVDQHIGAIGQIAGEKMLATLNGQPLGELSVVTEPILRVRASCGGRAPGEGKTSKSAIA
jgi:LacI family transcriptional regulator